MFGDRKAENRRSGRRSRPESGTLGGWLSGVRYQANPVSAGLLTVKVRYQAPDGAESRLLEFPLTDKGTAFADASRDFRFAAAVAEIRSGDARFAVQIRRDHGGRAPLGGQAAGPDTGGARSEFISLVKRAEAILQSAG